MILSRSIIPFALALLVSPWSGADEPVLIRQDSSGTAQLEGQRVLQIADVKGTLYIRLGTPGEVRFASRVRDNRREEHPVAIWLVGDVLQFRPIEQAEQSEILLEISVPPELALEVVTHDSLLTLSGLRGDVVVRGERLEIEGHGLAGSIGLELAEGRAKLSDVAGDVDADLREVQTELSRIQGDLRLTVNGGEVELEQLTGEVEVDIEGGALVATHSQRRVELEGNESKVRLSDLQLGATLALEETPLELFRAKGAVEIDSDSEVRFQDLDCEMTVRGYGASVRGTGNLRSLKVVSDSAQVRVENLGTNLFVEGDHLDIFAAGVQGDVSINVASSTVSLENTSGTVEVENEYGDISIRKAAKKVTVASREGDVTISELGGPLNLSADGDRVEVRWNDFTEEDSLIQNESGEVWVLLPLKWIGTVEAETEFGRIESNVNGVAVTDGGNRARGVVRRRAQPRLLVKSGGDVFLNSSVPGQEND